MAVCATIGYTTETIRNEHFRMYLTNFLGTEVRPGEKAGTRPDGISTVTTTAFHAEVPILLVELKKEPGEGGDPISQVALVMKRIWADQSVS